MPITLRLLTIVPLLALGACKAAVESELPPQPPMWVVSDADSEITLYPTLHILPPEVEWKSEELTRRLAEAEEVWFEIMPGADTDPALQQRMMQLGLAPGSSLSANLTEDEVATLKSATAGQLEMLASMPEEVQMDMLRDALGEMDETVEILRELVNDWSVGNVEDLEDDLLEEMKLEMPAAYDVLFTVRNKNWADQIEIEMKGSGTDFIAVGAGHLVGDDSVPAMLKSRGYTVTRL